MRFIAPILILFQIAAFAQEENSLLWEISGNGLEHSSYLYGTMHVSRRIAFRLDDVFYKALDQSQIVALESDPGTWLEAGEDLSYASLGRGQGFEPKGFYRYSFALKAPKKEQLAAYLAFEDYRVNNILYRSDAFSQNFEEETYLDMFIYQTGKKLGKKVVALENLEESTALVGRASLNAMKQKPDEWLQKKMQEQDPMTLLQDAYRNRNINLLDSLDKAMYTRYYLENMLFIRNRNMARQLDSIMPTAKVFTGIGAAHLPGDKGVIQMLRDMGYTVRPLRSKATVQGRRLKEKFERSVKQNLYAPRTTDDGFFSMLLPDKLYPVAEHRNTTYISPDLANGSYVMVNRIPIFSALHKEGAYTLEDVDQLLFENIPGKILEKTWIAKNGFRGLDIKNQLKNGNRQRYQIFITPLEMIIFKMGGQGDYVSRHSDTIFNSIRFPHKKIGTKVVSGTGDFEIAMPSLYTFPNRDRKGNRLIQGYDSIGHDYYFLQKISLNDFNFIEEDTFELKQIQKRFYQDLKLKTDIHYAPGTKNSLVSRAILDSLGHKKLHLRTVFHRENYFLMGAVTQDTVKAVTFFKSFAIKEKTYRDSFQKVRDTALFFTTITSIRPPKFVDSEAMYRTGRNRLKPYQAYTKKTIYQNRDNEAITVELNKAHDFRMFLHIDSVWAKRRKLYQKKGFVIQKERDTLLANGSHVLEMTLTDTASTRGILIKNVVTDGRLYELKAQTDTILGPSRFAKQFFENFRPTDTVVGKDVLVDKTPSFFAGLRANDSIVLEGYRLLQFQNKHVDSLRYYISQFDFPEDKKHIRSYLIQQMGALDHPKVIPFLKQLYLDSYNNSQAQLKVLQVLANKQDDEATRILLELLSRDLPLPTNTFEIRAIFTPYKDSLPLAKNLLPQLLEYSTIEEYKPSIFSLLAQLKNKGLVKPKEYKRYKKQIINDARIQLKRQMALSSQKGSRNYRNSRSRLNGVLESYIVLLYPFVGEHEVKRFFDRLSLIKDSKVSTAYAQVLARNGSSFPKEMLAKLAQDRHSRLLLFHKFKEIDRLDMFPEAYRNPKSMAESLLFEKRPYRPLRDSVLFVGQRPLTYRGNPYTGFYFKTRDNNDYDRNFTMRLVVFEDNTELTAKPFYKNKGWRIEDTDTEKEAMDYVTEEFFLKDRKRAEVYRPNGYGGYGYNGF
ncbi:MAG: TraB/GumN family protein [Bacteroidota bacterium]